MLMTIMLLTVMMTDGMFVDVRDGSEPEEINGTGSRVGRGTGKVSQHTRFQDQARPWQWYVENYVVFCDSVLIANEVWTVVTVSVIQCCVGTQVIFQQIVGK